MRPSYFVAAVASFVLGAGTLALADPPGSTPLGQWHLDFASPISGTQDSTPDTSGAGHDLVSCTGCIVTGAGGRFNGYLLDTSVNPATFSGGIRPDKVTLLAWIRRSGAPGKDEVIAAQAYDDSHCDLPSYRLGYNESGAGSQLQFSAFTGSSVASTSPIGSSPDVWDGAWHLAAGTFDGNRVRVYVDGTEIGESGATPASSIGYGNALGSFGVDGFTGNRSTCFRRDFTGGIDEVRVYGRALNSAELTGLATAPGATPPTLVSDTDQDGVPDSSDNCPTVPNPDQIDGGTGNGVGKACEPDTDKDGLPDPIDNCPAVANPDQIDGDHNGVGRACQKPVAVFTATPLPTCTDVLTRFIASGSHSDDPITDYRYSYGQVESNVFSGNQSFNTETFEASSPITTYNFYWNILALSVGSVARRDDTSVTLTVTTAGGQTADSNPVSIHFVQQKGSDSRSNCPAASTDSFRAPPISSVTSTSNAIILSTGCTTPPFCLGTATVHTSALRFVHGLRRLATTAAKKKRKKTVSVLIGSQRYAIRPGTGRKITIKLNKTGLALLKKNRTLKVQISLASVSPRGATVTTSKATTLRAKKRKKKK